MTAAFLDDWLRFLLGLQKHIKNLQPEDQAVKVGAAAQCLHEPCCVLACCQHGNELGCALAGMAGSLFDHAAGKQVAVDAVVTMPAHSPLTSFCGRIAVSAPAVSAPAVSAA